MDWRDINGYEGLYKINNLGNIKSLPRKETCKGEKILKQSLNTSGYPQICLTKNMLKKTFAIHILLMRSFIKNPLNKTQINHKDGIKTNNNIDNLEWCTPKENQQHAKRLGLRANGERHGSSKLTEKEVLIIRKLYNKEYNCNKLSSIFSVNICTIRDIINRRYWCHI